MNCSICFNRVAGRIGLALIVAILSVGVTVAQETKQAETIQSADLTKALSPQEDEAKTSGDGSLEQKASYLIGFNAVSQLLGDLKRQGLEIDNQFMLDGIKSAMDGKESKINQEEARALMTALQEKLTKQMVAKLEETKVRCAEFLADNAKKEGVKMLEDGVQYMVMKQGKSEVKPKPNDVVSIYYKGALIDGTVFDKTEDGVPLDRLQAGQFVPGFSQALQNMTIGSKWKVFIPAEQGYGARGKGGVGPNEAMVFEVELLDIVK